MRILSTIVEIATRSVPDVGQDFTMRNTVAAQAVGDNAPLQLTGHEMLKKAGMVTPDTREQRIRAGSLEA
jgi:hypothetical protein